MVTQRNFAVVQVRQRHLPQEFSRAKHPAELGPAVVPKDPQGPVCEKSVVKTWFASPNCLVADHLGPLKGYIPDDQPHALVSAVCLHIFCILTLCSEAVDSHGPAT